MTNSSGLTKCSGCRTYRPNDSFELNRLNVRYKTCSICRQRHKEIRLNKKNNERASSGQPTETHISIPPVVEQAPDVVAPDDPCEFYDISSEAAEEDIIIIPEGAEDDEEDKFIHDQEQFESFHSFVYDGADRD